MSYKLYADGGNFRAIKVLVAAEYNKVDIEVKGVEASKKVLMGRVPVLETAKGLLGESNAIARYIAGIRTDTGLMGATAFDGALVNQWIDFTAHEIELPATVWVYPVMGVMPSNPAATAKAKSDLAKALDVVEKHLDTNSYLVGHTITLADITLVSALLYPFKFVCDAGFRKKIPNVCRWFTTCVKQAEFNSIIGDVVLCEKETQAAAGGAGVGGAKKDAKPKEEKKKEEKKKEEKPKEEKPKEEKKKSKKDDDDEPEPDYVEEKKAEHPFKILDKSNPSTFVMDTWKKTYSNCDGNYAGAMNTFWETFDAAGWSIFRGDYNYNDENKVLWLTSNLIGGFIQRTEEIRKWLFGTMTIRGVEGKGPLKVTAYYLIRGDSIQPLLSCNDDASCYTWTKVNIPAAESDKKLLFDYWCSDGPLDGEPCLDSRCYK